MTYIYKINRLVTRRLCDERENECTREEKFLEQEN